MAAPLARSSKRKMLPHPRPAHVFSALSSCTLANSVQASSPPRRKTTPARGPLLPKWVSSKFLIGTWQSCAQNPSMAPHCMQNKTPKPSGIAHRTFKVWSLHPQSSCTKPLVGPGEPHSHPTPRHRSS